MKILIKTIIITVIFFIIGLIYINKNYDLIDLKIYKKLLFKPLDEIRDEYAAMDCKNLSEGEKKNGFEAFITAYCKPIVENYKNRKEFLCSVGLNCSCPAGRNEEKICSSNTFSWSPCLDFNDKLTPYCDKTASGEIPKEGEVAADWRCFPNKSTVNIKGKNYIVTDKGSIIKGRRFDIWFNNCQDTFMKTGIYNVHTVK